MNEQKKDRICFALWKSRKCDAFSAFSRIEIHQEIAVDCQPFCCTHYEREKYLKNWITNAYSHFHNENVSRRCHRWSISDFTKCEWRLLLMSSIQYAILRILWHLLIVKIWKENDRLENGKNLKHLHYDIYNIGDLTWQIINSNVYGNWKCVIFDDDDGRLMARHIEIIQLAYRRKVNLLLRVRFTVFFNAARYCPRRCVHVDSARLRADKKWNIHSKWCQRQIRRRPLIEIKNKLSTVDGWRQRKTFSICAHVHTTNNSRGSIYISLV